MVGEPIVHALEMFAEPIIVLVREGPSGLWEWIKEKLTDLKSMLLDEIQGWLITNVIEAGITWVISLLNPASAFLKACKAIYDIVKFFVERARQIADFVKAVTESIGAIARGSLGAAAQRVEDALARAIPVAIGFLASLLGLDDLSGTIERFIQRIRQPIEQAIRWLIGKAVDLVKAAGKLLGIGKDEGSEEGGEHDAQVAAGLAALRQAVTERAEWRVALGPMPSRSPARCGASTPSSSRSMSVDAEDSWRFHVVASDVKNNVELPKSEDGDQDVTVKADWVEVREDVVDLRSKRLGGRKESTASSISGRTSRWGSWESGSPSARWPPAPRSPVTPVAAARPLRRRLDWQMEMRTGGALHGKRVPDYRSVCPGRPRRRGS